MQLVTFCLEQAALTPTETHSGLDASCKVQESKVLMHDPAHRPSLATEETCHVITPSTRRTLQLSIHPFTLSRSQKTGQKKGREGKCKTEHFLWETTPSHNESPLGRSLVFLRALRDFDQGEGTPRVTAPGSGCLCWRPGAGGLLPGACPSRLEHPHRP